MTPQLPGIPSGEESALHSASTNQAIALREALLAFHGPASEGVPRRGGQPLQGSRGLGWGLAHP